MQQERTHSDASAKRQKRLVRGITIGGFRMWNSAYASINRGPAHANLKGELAACPHRARSAAALNPSLLGCDFSAPPVESVVNALNQRLSIKWLVQKADGAGLQRSRADSIVGIGGNEDRRNAQSQVGQTMLQFDPARIRQLNIGNQARCFRHKRRLQKCFCRRESASQESERRHQAFYRPSDNTVVINDRD
jgi:hypothetical protein